VGSYGYHGIPKGMGTDMSFRMRWELTVTAMGGTIFTVKHSHSHNVIFNSQFYATKFLLATYTVYICLQRFDAVGWAAGMASSL